MDYDKELHHIAEWLQFSVDFKIDQASDELNQKIESKRDFDIRFIESFRGFNLVNIEYEENSGQDRFYKRNSIKANHFKVFRREININEQVDYYILKIKAHAFNILKGLAESSLPYDGKMKSQEIADLTEAHIQRYEDLRNESLQELFGDDMPLKLNGLLEHAKWGGKTYNYNP